MARDNEAAFVGGIILHALGEATAPIPLRRLVEAIRDECAMWSYVTCLRRFKEGRSWLVRKGVPLLSCGDGFFLASKPHEFNAAARLKERAAKELWREARRLRRMVPQWREPNQGSRCFWKRSLAG